VAEAAEGRGVEKFLSGRLPAPGMPGKGKFMITCKTTLAAIALLMTGGGIASADSLPFYRDVHGNIIPNSAGAEAGGFPIPFINFNDPNLRQAQAMGNSLPRRSPIRWSIQTTSRKKLTKAETALLRRLQAGWS
jgi:hypothetical protein